MKNVIIGILVAIMVGLMAFCAVSTGEGTPEPKPEPVSGAFRGGRPEEVEEEPQPTESTYTVAAETDVSDPFSGGLVLMDNDLCVMVLTGIETDNYFGYAWNVTLKNKTDEDLMFDMDSVVVNGLQWDPYWAEPVPAGDGMETQICWYADPAEVGLEAVTMVEFDLSVYQTDNWDGTYLAEEHLTVYPLGEDAHTQTYQRESLDSDLVLVNDDNITMTLTAAHKEDGWGYTWYLYLENKTEHDLMFNAENICINGLVCDPFWSCSVSAGAKTVDSIHWYEEDFETAGITDVTMVELTLWVYDEEDWDAEYLYDGALTVYPMGQDAATVQTRESRPTDIVLVDNDLLSITVTNQGYDDLWGYTVELFLENKSEEDIWFSVEDATVNGRSLDPFWMESIPAGRQGYSEIFWFESELEDSHIPEVVEMELSFTAAQDDYPYAIVWNDTFCLTP